MTISIDDTTKLTALQGEFTQLFPFLKIEFFSKPHTYMETSRRKQMYSSNKTLGECRTIHSKGTIRISPQMTVGKLEKDFNDLYGLNVQVFRKSGKSWIETSITDDWTLEKQNSQGKELSYLTG